VGWIAVSHSNRYSATVLLVAETYSPRSSLASRSIRARSASRLVWNPECHFCLRAPVAGSGSSSILTYQQVPFLTTEPYNRTGDAVEPGLLLPIDEAANTRLPTLPAMGLHRHRRRHPARHRLAIQSATRPALRPAGRQRADKPPDQAVLPQRPVDSATTDYLSTLAGTEHVRGDLNDTTWIRQGADPASGRTPATAVPLLPASVLRQMRVGDTPTTPASGPRIWQDDLGPI